VLLNAALLRRRYGHVVKERLTAKRVKGVVSAHRREVILGWVWLGAAITVEVIATMALRYSDGFTRWWPSVVAVVGYGAAFVLLSQVLKTISVGLAYATWSGLGTAGAAVGAWLLFGERFSGLAITGIALIIVGVGVLSMAGTNHA
jgi:small multidrug resistance pump